MSVSDGIISTWKKVGHYAVKIPLLVQGWLWMMCKLSDGLLEYYHCIPGGTDMGNEVKVFRGSNQTGQKQIDVYEGEENNRIVPYTNFLFIFTKFYLLTLTLPKLYYVLKLFKKSFIVTEPR